MTIEHEFKRGTSGFCVHPLSSGAGIEWCGCSEDRHRGASVPEETEASKIGTALKAHESTKRALFHLVNSYQSFRDFSMPNELTDDAARIGEQHLREVDWFPEDKGWLANNTDTSPNDGDIVSHHHVLTLIDKELERLREPISEEGIVAVPWRKRRAWRDGVRSARSVTASRIQEIRNAYALELLTRETEALGLYDIDPKVVQRD